MYLLYQVLENHLERDPTVIYSCEDRTVKDRIEHAWLPACQQENCRVNIRKGCLAQGSFREMWGPEVGHPWENLGGEEV